MNISQHGNHLVKLTRLTMFNCFLVREKEGLTLIDVGIPGSANAILNAAKELGAPITGIALTHAHADHVGSLDEIRQRLPDAEVFFTKRTARFLAGDQSLEPGEPQDKLRGSYVERETQPTRIVQPGDGVGSLRIVASPGHTPDHVAFLDERDGTLIAGDAFQTKAGLAVAGTWRWLFPLPAMATWHKPTALASARRLHDLQPARLAVGHGRVLEQPTATMAKAIQEAEQALS